MTIMASMAILGVSVDSLLTWLDIARKCQIDCYSNKKHRLYQMLTFKHTFGDCAPQISTHLRWVYRIDKNSHRGLILLGQ